MTERVSTEMKEITVKKNNSLFDNAKELRRELTEQEKHLWYDFLRNYPIKVYKQRIIDSFIVDFYCHKAMLVIELDGSQHYTSVGKENDKARTKALEKYGLYILRFSNKDVDDNFSGVCSFIDKKIKERIK